MSLEEAIKAAVVEALKSVEAREALRQTAAVQTSVRAGPEVDDKAYTVAEVAELSGYKPKAILERIDAGDLVATKPIGCREWRIRRADYRTWLAGGEHESRDPDDVVRSMLAGGR
jgi:excisionase family DNA binding protein